MELLDGGVDGREARGQVVVVFEDELGEAGGQSAQAG